MVINDLYFGTPDVPVSAPSSSSVSTSSRQYVTTSPPVDTGTDTDGTVTIGGLIDDDIILRSLANIYNKDFHPDKEIEPEAFRAVWTKINEATNKGYGTPGPKDPDYDFYNQIQTNNAVFAAFKVHRAQHDMAALLTDGDGKLKPFKQWLNDVQPIASHQYGPWLRTEYDTAVIRAHQAADWQQFEREKDVLPNLEWMPSTSVHPGEDHTIFWGTIMPIDDPFWDAHRPGDRWNCKCSLQATDKQPTDVPDDIKPVDNPQPGLDNNPGKDAKLFSDSHPYIANANKKTKLEIDDFVNSIKEETASPDILYCTGNYKKYKNYGMRLLINKNADPTELKENTRCAESLLSDTKNHIVIKGNSNEVGVKNPEYVINGLIADRKGIMSEKGVTSAFKKAIKQGCSSVVIDLDMNMEMFNINKLAQHLWWRKCDFKNNVIDKCYIVFGGKFVVIDNSVKSKKDIIEILKK